MFGGWTCVHEWGGGGDHHLAMREGGGDQQVAGGYGKQQLHERLMIAGGSCSGQWATTSDSAVVVVNGQQLHRLTADRSDEMGGEFFARKKVDHLGNDMFIRGVPAIVFVQDRATGYGNHPATLLDKHNLGDPTDPDLDDDLEAGGHHAVRPSARGKRRENDTRTSGAKLLLEEDGGGGGGTSPRSRGGYREGRVVQQEFAGQGRVQELALIEDFQSMLHVAKEEGRVQELALIEDFQSMLHVANELLYATNTFVDEDLRSNDDERDVAMAKMVACENTLASLLEEQATIQQNKLEEEYITQNKWRRMNMVTTLPIKYQSLIKMYM